MNWQPIEEWRVCEHPRYEVSSLGRVRCGDRILKQWLSDQGYALARLSKPRSVARVHRLVAEAFVPNPEGKPSVNHIDCNRSNNHAENLEWCTQLENIRHSDRLGRMRRDYWVGKRSPVALLSDDSVREIRRIYAGGNVSMERLGRSFKISKRAVGRLLHRETYADVK